MGDRVDVDTAMSDNQRVAEVEYVTVSLRVLKREALPDPAHLPELLKAWGLYDRSQESVWVLAYDSSGYNRRLREVARGSYHSVDVPIAAVMSTVHLSAADRFWLVHNHPGGSAAPSPADLDLTTKVMNAANTNGLRMEDHLIIAPPDQVFSFAQAGIIRAGDEVVAAAAGELVVSPLSVVHRTDVRE